MTQKNRPAANEQDSVAESRREKKKAYQKPEFRSERAFETMALNCGKIAPTQSNCRTTRKAS
jgi:hypothetical protein